MKPEMGRTVKSSKLAQVAILTIVLGLTAVLAVGVWKGKGQKEQQVAPPPSESPEPEMKLTDMEYTEMQEGRRLWSLKASEARYFQDEQKTLLSSVLLTFFLEDGTEIRLESRKGILFAGTKNIELWDSVHAVMPKGYELSTERAFYDHEVKRIISQTVISVSGPDLQLEGRQWEYRIPEHMAVLDGGVTATLRFAPPGGAGPSSARQQ
jgi:LPS export ABC transporter protein LptC